MLEADWSILHMLLSLCWIFAPIVVAMALVPRHSPHYPTEFAVYSIKALAFCWLENGPEGGALRERRNFGERQRKLPGCVFR
jgi:hypothetical protein